MPRTRKYAAFTESQPFPVCIDHISIQCPRCNLAFVDIPAASLSKKKNLECKKHLRTVHAEEEEVNRKRSAPDTSPTEADDQSDALAAMRLQVAKLEMEKTALELQLANREALDAGRDAETATLKEQRDTYRVQLDDLTMTYDDLMIAHSQA